jgi:hypothetical protein
MADSKTCLDNVVYNPKCLVELAEIMKLRLWVLLTLLQIVSIS